MTNINPYDIAVIFLHPACNMTCTFCITEDNFDTMTHDQALGLIQTLKKRKFKSIVFGGGEPFEWPGDLVTLTEEAKQLGFLVQVGTNGIKLPGNFQNVKSIDRFVLPLESSKSDVHNQMRFYKNKHHQLITDALEQLRKAQKSVTISTIITKVNKDELPALALFLKKLNTPKPFIHAWHLYKFLPQGRGGEVNAEALKISEQEYTKICTGIQSMGLSFKVFQRKDMYHSKTVEFFWYEHGKLQEGSEANKIKALKKTTVPFV